MKWNKLVLGEIGVGVIVLSVVEEVFEKLIFEKIFEGGEE